MKLLGRHVISTARSGTYQFAVVEEMSNSRATVRLGYTGRGSRITNLHVAGEIYVGDLAIVDYSVGKPYVRQAYIDEGVASELSLAPRYSYSSSLGTDPEES